jgi:hypothetical protein
MITFLPYPNFEKTAIVLDSKRLGKMRVESAQILRTLGIEGVLLSPPKPRDANKKQAWINHPAVRMWVGHEKCLQYYYDVISDEWKRRGYKHNMGFFHVLGKIIYPPWFRNERFHSSHRAALLYKNYEWYKQFDWKETPKIDYIWPK